MSQEVVSITLRLQSGPNTSYQVKQQWLADIKHQGTCCLFRVREQNQIDAEHIW
jgi:hypothetical protein